MATPNAPKSVTVEAWTGTTRLPEQLAETMLVQRSMRRVHPDPIDDELILECIRFAVQAPTAFNQQGWAFVIVKDRETKHELAELYRKVWKVYRRIVDRPGVSPAQHRSLVATQWQVANFEEIPAIVVVAQSGRPHREPALQSSFYGSIYPAVQNLLLAAVGLGLGAAPVTMPVAFLHDLRQALGLPADMHPCCLVTLGRPVGKYGTKPRRDVGEVTHLESWGYRPWLRPTGQTGNNEFETTPAPSASGT